MKPMPFIVTRTKDLPSDFKPGPGYAEFKCEVCGESVLIGPRGQSAVEEWGAKVVCNVCGKDVVGEE